MPGVLARHGIDPDADAGELAAILAGRGWAVALEEEETAPRPSQRWRVLATRPRPDAGPRLTRPGDHVQARGRTEVAALGRAVAKALAHDEAAGA